jgi:glycosyltransferase involved in cell wall biosynthesis
MHVGIDAREICDEPTGAGRYLQCLLHEWCLSGAARRHSFTLYVPPPQVGSPPGLDANVVIVPGDGRTWWEQTALAAAVRRDRPDVFFAPAYTAPLRLPCPLVLALHDISFVAHPEWFRWREGLRRRTIVRAAARRARVILTLSEFSRSEIATRLRVPPDRILAIPAGVGLHLAGPRSADAHRSPLVLFVGSVFNRRHVPELIAGFSQLAAERADIRLEIVGADRTHPAQQIAALAAASPASSRIRWHSYVSDEELARLYGTARVLAFLSSYEGFGLTPLEGLAAGVPPLVLDTPVAREVYGPAALYISTPHPDAVADGLARLLRDGEDRHRVLDHAPAILARYRWEATAAATLNAIERAAS